MTIDTSKLTSAKEKANYVLDNAEKYNGLLNSDTYDVDGMSWQSRIDNLKDSTDNAQKLSETKESDFTEADNNIINGPTSFS